MLAAVESGAATAIRRRMHELGLSQKELGVRIGRSQAWISQELLKDPEHTIRYLWVKSPGVLDRLLQALQWTPEEFTEATGLEVPFVRPAREKPGEEYVILPVFGSAAAGPPWPTVEYVPLHKALLRPGTLVFKVEGDSMDTGDEDGIRDGDYVLVDPALNRLQEGKIYLVEIAGDGLAVKRAKRAGRGWVFTSDNPTGPVLTPDEVKVVGEVYRIVSIREPK